MECPHNAIVLIGFKHTGKSVVGKSVAHKLNIPFLDLDQKIEMLYHAQFNEQWSCRQIMQHKGEEFFRSLESAALSQVVGLKPSVISLGGGAPLRLENQNLIKSCIVIHVTSPREVVFERIRASGQPAFFNSEEDLLESFNKMWDDRRQIYEEIRNFTIENNRSVEEAVFALTKKLKQCL